MKLISIEIDKCTCCGACLDFCPKNVFAIDTKKRQVCVVNEENCNGCKICEKECVSNCIKINPEGDGYEYIRSPKFEKEIVHVKQYNTLREAFRDLLLKLLKSNLISKTRTHGGNDMRELLNVAFTIPKTTFDIEDLIVKCPIVWSEDTGEQLRKVCEEMRLGTTRQAYITIMKKEYLDNLGIPGKFGKPPCFVGMHFLNRYGILHMTVHFRSSDVTKLGWDLTWFANLHRFVARDLCMGLGSFTVFIDTLHYFPKNNLEIEYLKERLKIERI